MGEKETKSRQPVTCDHPMVAAAILVLEEQTGEGTHVAIPSVAIFRRAVELGLVQAHQYNSMRARLSQHCDLANARVLRAKGSKVGVRGSRTTSWVLRESNLGIQPVPMNGGLVIRRELSPAKRRHLARRRRARRFGRDVILSDDTLTGAPESVRLVAGRTAREALTSALTEEALTWLLGRLPLEPEFRARLEATQSRLGRLRVIVEEERGRRTA